ncbi:MAG: dolichyl-phosphate beta-glucosyltransferase [Thermomicrobiales bacterium]
METATATSDTTTVITHLGGTAPRPWLSLIIPAWNESKRITSSLRAIAAYFATVGYGYEVIVIDDGSSDDTAAIVTRIAEDYPQLRLISYQSNCGKGHAVRTGVQAARGPYIMFTDADLSIPVTITAELLAALTTGDYDLAIASRWHPDSTIAVPPPMPRRLMGSVFRWCVRRLVTSDVRDTQCGCKAYRAEVARHLFGLSQIERFSFDAEVIFLAHRAGYRIQEVPFALHYHHGSSVRPARDAILMLRDLVRIRLRAAHGGYGAIAVPIPVEQAR